MRKIECEDCALPMIVYNDKEYPVREVSFDGMHCLVSTVSLERVLLEHGCHYVSDEAKKIDESIIFFVDDDVIHLPDALLAGILSEHIY